MPASKIDSDTAWAIIMVLCVGTYVICMLYITLFGTKWRGYGNAVNAQREVLRFQLDDERSMD